MNLFADFSSVVVPPAGETAPPPWLAEIKGMLMEHDRELKAQKGEFVRKSRPTASPFTPEVIADPPPEKGSLPIVKSYDETGDPEEHIRYFNKLAMTFTLNDGMQCKLFATNLSGVANTWFDSLDPGSVPNFEVLVDKFLN